MCGKLNTSNNPGGGGSGGPKSTQTIDPREINKQTS